MVDFTVAIRTYNGEKRLPAVLEKLRSQVDTESFCWEIAIVDNNSTDNTAKIIQQYQSNWLPSSPINYYLETKQGASFARQRAIQEARGTLIGFLDDDNVPTTNWVSAAWKFGKSHPQAGAYGSVLHGDYEVEPPKNFRRIASFLAIVEWKDKDPFCLSSLKGAKRGLLPPGAGLVVRKRAWIENVPTDQVLKGPVAGDLGEKGEDIEALSYIKKAGWEIWFNPEMEIHHQIPKTRFEKDYLMRLMRGVGLSRHRTRMLGYEKWQRPFMVPVYVANDFRKLIVHSVKYRDVLDTDVVAASEREYLIYSLMSHFYALFKPFNR